MESAATKKPLKVLECRDLLPDTKCTLFFVGDVNEVTQAFGDHAARAHPDGGGDHPSADIEGKLQAAVFVSPDRAYVGDGVEQPDDQTIRIPGPGFVLQRFAESAATSLMCKCSGAVGTCTIQLDGHTANCLSGTCLNCGWSVDIPSVTVDPKIKPEFE